MMEIRKAPRGVDNPETASEYLKADRALQRAVSDAARELVAKSSPRAQVRNLDRFTSLHG